MANNVNFDSYFTDRIVDPKGVSICDMNMGLNNLYKYFVETKNNFSTTQRYLVPEQDDGYPDAVAYKSILGSQAFWWWVLLINEQDDGLEGIKENWAYSIVDGEQINSFIQDSTSADEASTDERIGTVIELN
jgi:hypothetical protein